MRAPRPYVPESVDPTEVSPSGPRRAFKQAGLVLLAAAWVIFGLLGHDPWKLDDATAFGVAWEMVQHGDYVVPHLAGEAWLTRPPLMPALAAIAINVASPPFAPFNAARLAVGVVLALTLLFTALASREFSGRAFRWLPVLILIGSVGLWERAHIMSGELGTMFGVAVALYGFALALRRPIVGGIVLGAGAAIAFLSNGVLAPAWIIVTGLILPAIGSVWRTRGYAVTSAVALLSVAILSAPWLIAINAREPGLLSMWLANEAPSNYFALLGSDGGDLFYQLRNLPWFAWPALPLVIWTLWLRGRGFNSGLNDPGLQVPGVLAIIIFVTLSLAPEPKAISALPLLVPLALLAALEIDTLKRGYSAALDWFGILTFGLLGLIGWALWIDSRVNGMSSRVAVLFRDTELGFQPTFHLGSMIAAVALTVLWIMLVRPARRTNRRAVLNWAAGVTLLWGLYSTIWLPYVDSRRTYRPMIDSITPQLLASGCVQSRNLGEAQRALFQYFAGLTTVREEADHDADCPLLLVQYGRQEAAAPAIAGWNVIWEGRRRGDDTERYVLYRRSKR